MKRTALRHPKLFDLCSRLSINRREAIGLLSLLWDWAADHALDGNLRPGSDVAIAQAVDWPIDDAEKLMGALTDAGWIDKGSNGQLSIHDWADHRERWVTIRAQRAQARAQQPPGRSRKSSSTRRSVTAKPPQRTPDTGRYTAVFLAFWSHYPRAAKKPAAASAYAKAAKDVGDDLLLDRVKAYEAAVRPLLTKHNRNLVPHASNWLNQERHNEQPAEWTAPFESGAGRSSAADERRAAQRDAEYPEGEDRVPRG